MGVLISIKPQWVEKIIRGLKTVEVRKTMPKCKLPCKVYIYCTKGKQNLYIPQEFNAFECDDWSKPYFAKKPILEDVDYLANGKVVAEFTLKNLVKFDIESLIFMGKDKELIQKSCLGGLSLRKYLGNKIGYSWGIDDLKIYDKPKELSEFRKDLDCDDYPCNKNYDCKYSYYDNSEGCWACGIDFDGSNCIYKQITRPPQSWCYVEG